MLESSAAFWNACEWATVLYAAAAASAFLAASSALVAAVSAKLPCLFVSTAASFAVCEFAVKLFTSVCKSVLRMYFPSKSAVFA